ncbi:hypothetical protein NL676_007519 [Syzygium grande]|nr:hypothetical protein NL676_007519 [Syzygium grande]
MARSERRCLGVAEARWHGARHRQNSPLATGTSIALHRAALETGAEALGKEKNRGRKVVALRGVAGARVVKAERLGGRGGATAAGAAGKCDAKSEPNRESAKGRRKIGEKVVARWPEAVWRRRSGGRTSLNRGSGPANERSNRDGRAVVTRR